MAGWHPVMPILHPLPIERKAKFDTIMEKSYEGEFMLFEEKHSRQNYSTTLYYHDMHTIPHCQSSAEILLVSRGSVRAGCRSQVFSVHAGQCIWIMPYEVHSYDTLEENDVSVYIFSSDLLPDFFQFMNGRRLLHPVVPFPQDTLNALSEENTDPFSRKAALYTLASLALRGGTSETGQRADLEPMYQIMQFIQSHYLENVSLHDLARHLGYSYNYTSHLFRQYFPSGFCEMINMHRLDEAARLLREPGASITEVAARSGFSTIRSFNGAFRKQFSMTPTEYCRSRDSKGTPAC